MKKILTATVTACALSYAASAIAAYPPGDAKAGQQKAATCAACHGADGNSISPQFPKLAGQNASYIVKQLEDYKSGARKNAIMAGMAASLSEQDMRDIAAYFAGQKIKPGAAAPNLVADGRELYLGGDHENGIPACAACHGPTGVGNGPAVWPALAGQYQQYLVTELKAWRDGSRHNGPKKMMREVAARLTDHQIQAVASYLQGLHTSAAAINPLPEQSGGGR